MEVDTVLATHELIELFTKLNVDLLSFDNQLNYNANLIQN